MELNNQGQARAAGRRLKPKAVAAALGVIVLLGAFVFLDGGEKAVAKEDIKPPPPAIPSGPVTSLPTTYDGLKAKEEIPIPVERPLMETSDDTGDPDLLKLERTELLNKAKRASQARLAEVFIPVRGELSARRAVVPSPPLSESELSGSIDQLPTTALGLPMASEDDNRQGEKKGFLNASRGREGVLSARIRAPESTYQVMAGTVIPGVLITGINSDLPGQILGQVSQGTYDTVTGNHLLIPQGTKIVGEYDSEIVYGQERVLIVWTRLIFPNGRSLSLEGMPGVDMTGYAGLSDKVNNHYLKLLSGVVVSSVLSAGSRVAQGGSRTVDPSLGQLGAEGFAMNIDQVGQQIARKNLNIQPTIEIEPGKRFSIFVNKDLVLEPYR